MTIGEFAEKANTYCQLTGASEVGGRRTAARNKDKSGVAHSAHLAGLARDVVYDVEPPKSERGAWAAAMGLRILFEPDHDHLQPLEWPPG